MLTTMGGRTALMSAQVLLTTMALLAVAFWLAIRITWTQMVMEQWIVKMTVRLIQER
jgi:hypothetical protein